MPSSGLVAGPWEEKSAARKIKLGCVTILVHLDRPDKSRVTRRRTMKSEMRKYIKGFRSHVTVSLALDPD